MLIAKSDKSFFITFKHWADGEITSEEAAPILSIDAIKEAIDGCEDGKGVEVIEFNPVEGWSRDVTEDVVNRLHNQSEWPWAYVCEDGLAKLVKGGETYSNPNSEHSAHYRGAAL